MNVPESMERVVGGLRYRVKTATLLADNAYWDGSNFERQGRNSFLYRTPSNRFFVVNLSMWQGEKDSLNPITEAEAIELYEGPLTEHHVPYEEAFPSAKVQEA